MVTEQVKESSNPIENFLVVEWDGEKVNLLCTKCEGSFTLDPSSNEDQNLIWCTKKQVLVPQCPHCHITDAEE